MRQPTPREYDAPQRPATGPEAALPEAASRASPVSPFDEAIRPLLREAGLRALQLFRHAVPSRKPDGSLVTRADHEAQAIILAGLDAAFPGVPVLAEEGATTVLDPEADAFWVVDPIDGTSAFVEGLAHWGPTLALLQRDRSGALACRCGATWLPRLDEYFYVEQGLGAFRDGETLPPLPGRPEGPGDILYVPSRMHRTVRLDWPGKARSLGSIGAHLALAAAGSARGVVVGPGWRLWDTAAGLALIWQAGGVARRPDGEPLDLLHDEGRSFVAGSREAVDWLTRPGVLTPSQRE